MDKINPDRSSPSESLQRKRWPLHVAVVTGALALTIFASLQISPRPVAWLVALLFDKGAETTSQALAPHVPGNIDSLVDQSYGISAPKLGLDVYRPIRNGQITSLPTVVWIHGGGWISGRKEDVGNYLKILAAYGFTTVSIDYSLAPDAPYPTQVHEVNVALAYLVQNAQRLGIDSKQLFLAGDSAGAQIAAQIANIISSSYYARKLGITPSIFPHQLKGVLLFCGFYDFGMVNLDGVFGIFIKNVLWAFVGDRDFQRQPAIDEMSVVRHVTAAFPPAFISAGNTDPLLPHSVAMATQLRKLGVTVDSLFFEEKHIPQLGHEYQFNVDNADGQAALKNAVRFLQEHSEQRKVDNDG